MSKMMDLTESQTISVGTHYHCNFCTLLQENHWFVLCMSGGKEKKKKKGLSNNKALERRRNSECWPYGHLFKQRLHHRYRHTNYTLIQHSDSCCLMTCFLDSFWAISLIVFFAFTWCNFQRTLCFWMHFKLYWTSFTSTSTFRKECFIV